MKTLFVEICADQAISSEYFAVNVPNDIDEIDLKRFFDRRTKYGVRVTTSKFDKPDVKVFNFNDAVAHIKVLKLYTLKSRNHYREIEVVDKVFEFTLSTCFSIEDVKVSYKCSEEGVTFFYVTTDASDITFNDKAFKQALGLKVAESKAYYKHGTWRFYRSKRNPAKYKFVKIRKEEVLDYIEHYIDVL